MLPSCFRPNAECRAILQRVEAGYDVQHYQAVPYIQAGLIEVVEGPSAGSGYKLTEDGRETLAR